MPTPLNVDPQLFYGGVWVPDIPVYTDDGPATIDVGYTDEGTIRPSQMSMRINDAAAPTLNPLQAASPLYGTGGRAIPAAIFAGTPGSLRAWLETSQVDPDQTPGYTTTPPRGRRWLDITAQGPLYRIGQWSDTVQSPMSRTLSQYTSLIGYWKGEDPSTSTALSTTVGNFGQITDTTFGDLDAPPGAGASFVTGSNTSMVLSPKTVPVGTGFQVFWSAKIPANPASTLTLFQWRANRILFSFDVDPGGWTLNVSGPGGVALGSFPTGWGTGVQPTTWAAYRAKCYQSAGNIVAEVAWYSLDTPLVVWGVTDSCAGTLENLTSLRTTGNAMVNGTKWDHIGAVQGITDDLQSSAAVQAFRGYTGETTTARWLRLLTEAGLDRSVIGSSTIAMGPQKPDTLSNLLREIGATEDGLIFDKRDAIEIVLRTRASRYRQTPALALALADLIPPTKPRMDNSGVQNLVTIEDRSGATATSELAAGALSTADYPAGIGVFKGGAFPDVKVNVADPSQLQDLADWYLARGTVDAPRFPQVKIEVGLDSPALQTATAALIVGDRITVAGLLPDTLNLQVIGISEVVNTHEWPFTLTCIPDDAFQIGVYDTLNDRYDSASTTLNAALTTTATAAVFKTTDLDDVWALTGAGTPYDVLVAGERMTVTAMGAVTGTGPWTQNATVTRSVNGVVKAPAAATAVHVFESARYA